MLVMLVMLVLLVLLVLRAAATELVESSLIRVLIPYR